MSPSNKKPDGLTGVKPIIQTPPDVIVLESDKFVPQKNSNTCWAACLTSILKQFKFKYRKTVLDGKFHDMDFEEEFFYKNSSSSMSVDRAGFLRIAAAIRTSPGSNINPINISEIPLESEGLEGAVTGCITSKNYCIYYFNIAKSTYGHFVIIYGYERNSRGTWFYIFDPKPDNFGQHYVINSRYLSESFENKTNTNYNSTNMKNSKLVQDRGLFRISNTGVKKYISLDLKKISIPDIGKKDRSARVEYIREFVSASSLCLRRSLNLDKDIIEEDTIFIGYNTPENAIPLDHIPEVGQSTAFRRFTHLIPMVKKVKNERGKESLQFLCGFFFRKDADYFDRVNGLGEFNDNALLKSYIEQNYTKEGFGISVFIEDEYCLAAVVSTGVSTGIAHRAFILVEKSATYFSNVLGQLGISGTQIQIMNPNPLRDIIRDNRW